MRNLAIFIFLVTVLGCNEAKEPLAHASQNRFLYARNIFSRPGSDTVVVYFSFADGRDSVVYSLNARETSSTAIATPVESIAALSTTDVAMLSLLGAAEKITGVCDPFRISDSTVRQLVSAGKIQNIGTSMETDREKLLLLNPDVILSTAFNKAEVQTMQKSAKPAVFMMAWQENSPLARLEWIKFIGLLIGEEAKADSVFSEIERDYLALRELAAEAGTRPKVLAGSGYNDIWYMAGGESYVATFIADAGGEYLWSDDTHTGSVPVSFEQVLSLSHEADVWIGCDYNTLSELDAASKNYRLLSVYQKRSIYNRNKRAAKDGGNDFWELGSVRPDLVLGDYIQALHPELLPGREMVFFEKVSE